MIGKETTLTTTVLTLILVMRNVYRKVFRFPRVQIAPILVSR